MIQLAKRKAVELKIENNEFVQTTIFDEKFKQETFDIILAFNILHLLDNRPMVFKRINDLLKLKKRIRKKSTIALLQKRNKQSKRRVEKVVEDSINQSRLPPAVDKTELG